MVGAEIHKQAKMAFVWVIAICSKSKKLFVFGCREGRGIGKKLQQIYVIVPGTYSENKKSSFVKTGILPGIIYYLRINSLNLLLI